MTYIAKIIVNFLQKIGSIFSRLRSRKLLAIIGLILFIIAIPLIVVFIQSNQDIRQRASNNVDPIIQALEIKDANGNELQCDTSKDPPECASTTQDVMLRVKDINVLSQ